MLDWLSAHQATSTAEESQIPEAPETPAPIFAYRALKGILFGSPDYDNEDEDKENIAPEIPIPKIKESLQKPSQKSEVSSSPLRSKSPNNRARQTHPVLPSARKRRQLSPTKSILRTPGIPTPRRQNANVTFKDVRPSVSPTTVTTKLLAAKSKATAAKSTEKGARVLAKTTTADVPREDTKAADIAGPLPVPVYDMGSVDAYLTSTEREMKKLVRYSQRMREYARVSQQQNAALRKERDELKRELEELRKTKIKGRGTLDELVLGKASSSRAAQQGVDNTGEKRGRESSSEAERLDKIHTAKTTKLSNRNASGRDFNECEPRTQPGEEPKDQKEAEDIVTQDKGQVGVVVSKKPAVTRAQLPPDRLAAAKERLRIKSEERRRALSIAVG
jgi:hypothetical protein